MFAIRPSVVHRRLSSIRIGGTNPAPAGDRSEPARSADEATPGPGPADPKLLHQSAHAAGEHATARERRRQFQRLRGLLAVPVPAGGAGVYRPGQGAGTEAALSRKDIEPLCMIEYWRFIVGSFVWVKCVLDE